MILWIDAQLPPALAGWLERTFGLQAVALRDLGLRDSSDVLIFEKARAAGAVLVSKDGDFVELVLRNGPPPRLLWLTCGNVTNRALQGLLQKTLSQALTMLDAGEAIVEIGVDGFY